MCTKPERVLSFIVFAALLCFGFLVPGSTQAEPLASTADLSGEAILFEDIPSVYSASKHEQKVIEAPSAVTVITAEEIKKYGYRTLADILQSVNGFYVTSDRDSQYLGMRGFNRPGDHNSRVLLMVDGHRLNDNIYDSAAISTDSPVDVDLIERVEVIRGPSSSLYGANAFFGVINVITKRGRDIKGFELSSEGGSYGSYKPRLTYGNRWSNGAELLVSGSFYDSDGKGRLYFPEYDSPTTHNGIVKNADGDRAYTLFGKFSLGDFILQGGAVSNTKQIPTAAFGSAFNTTHSYTTGETRYLSLQYEHEFARQWGLAARLDYSHLFYKANFLFDLPGIGNARAPFRTYSRGDWWGGEVKLTKRLLDKHQLTVGVEYRDNLHQDQWSTGLTPLFLPLDDRRSSRIWALYIQDEFALRDNLTLNLGGRYDHYGTFGGTFNPRLALIYNFDTKTTVKLLYGQAFRAPNVFEMYYTTGSFFRTNPQLKPETITTYEAVVDHALSTHFHSAVSAYYYTATDLISVYADWAAPLFEYRNLQNVSAKGLEFDLDGRWASGLEGRLSYALQRTQDEQTHKPLTNSPEHLVKFTRLGGFHAKPSALGVNQVGINASATCAHE